MTLTCWELFIVFPGHRSVASISNDTDPDGKMKILTKLWVKLPYRNVADIMEVKVNDGAKANILPLHTFRSMFPPQTRWGWLPNWWCPERIKDNAPMLWHDGKLVNHGTITLRLKHYAKDSFQDHQFFTVETPTRKEIIIGHPVSVRLGLIQVLCKNHAKTVSSIEADQINNLFWVHNIDGKTRWSKWSSSEPKSDRRRKSSESATGQNKCERTETSSFQDPKHQMKHPYTKITCIWSKSSSLQDHSPWWQEQKWQNKVISSTLDPEHHETSPRTQSKVLFAD